MGTFELKDFTSNWLSTNNVLLEKSKPHISVIIPVHNEETNISIRLTKIQEILNSTLQSYEIVVVNDGSGDNTLEVLRKREKLDIRFRIISYEPNRGKGYAVKTGVVQSYGNMVIFVDGDNDISPSKIEDYIKELESYDLVIASKRHPLSKVNAPVSRKILSRIFNMLVQLTIGIKIKDTQSGMKAGVGDALRTIFKVMVVKRYAFDVELLTIASALNLKIKEMPIEIDLDNKFKVREIAKMLLDIAAIWYRLRIRRWYYYDDHQIQK